jgi:hypothetical protein
MNELQQPDNNLSPFVIGKKYLIRTVTMIQTGELVSQSDKFLVLKDAAWIADTGRFSEALRDQSKFNEVEPFKNEVIVAIGAIIDATEIDTCVTKVK